MNFKMCIFLLTFLIGCILTIQAYPNHDGEGSDPASLQTKDVSSNPNYEINDSAMLQQEIAASEKSYDALNNMNVESKTETTLKNVHNISDNQLSNEYTSIEHEYAEAVDQRELEEEEEEEEDDEDNTATVQSSKRNSNDSNIEEESETEDPFGKKSRTGRLLPKSFSTSVPEYIRTKTKPIDEQNLTKKDVNLSTSDIMEDEAVSDYMLRKPTTKKTFTSPENEEIVPLAMNYYDDVPQENSSSSLQVDEEENGEDLNAANKLQNNEPVSMPQQQFLPQSHPPQQTHSKHYQQQNVSSEEYYEDEEYHEEESTTTTSTSAPQASDNNLIRALFGGFQFPFNPTTTTTGPSTTTATPSITTFLSNNNPKNEQFDSSLVTTSAPQPPNTVWAAAAAAAFSAAGDKKGKQIPIVTSTTATSTLAAPASASASTTSRRRLLPHEQLRNYIEDAYIRMPLAVIVDPSAESLEKTKALWNDAMRSNLNIKIVLVTLNESEESPASFNFNNTRQFLTSLNSIKEQNGGDTFRGISHAAELVPYDSAVFISTAKLAEHTDQVQDSAITLLKKRIRLYLIWFGERSLSENETQDSVGGILGEVAIRSGGEVLHIVGSENLQELEGSTLTIVADALRGSQEVDVPVDTTLSSLHVKIDKLMRRAVLETPNGG